MRLLIVRHAKAEEREIHAATGAPDAERPLTEAGRKSARKIGRALKDILPRIDVLASSPFVRAHETARLIAREYRRLDVVALPALTPGVSGKTVLAWLQEQAEDATVAMVGHEPDLGRLGSWLLTGRDQAFLTIKKGGACLLDFPEAPSPGHGQLAWLLAPAQLRRLGA
ncbi:phosphohistidine phosphatase [Sulfurifustis variabilis]|uniref:Phosphohistidine phosphatase n=1 Tax=Sulfurifustis variabilis TaxID=1675686 RepID=A0A1B4V0W0_9GAMM|nr:phosphohistidine phosphatase SixA [Sulfurifustis variabilis]BAU46973.1 phosphohistidine phosphatase [Sulfurifustis variabilis]